MARTRRRTSYRRSRRWNPDAVPAAAVVAPKTNPRRRIKRRTRKYYAAFTSSERNAYRSNPKRRHAHRRGRNPYTKHLPDGSRLRVSDGGGVDVYDEGGRHYSHWSIHPYEIPRLLKSVHRGSHKDHYSTSDENLANEYHTYRANPKRRGRKSRSHKARGHRGHKRKNRYGKYMHRFSKSAYKSSARHHKRGRRNPSAFPAPFFSALMNPGRRHHGRKSRTRRHARGALRRNHPIKRKDARAMKRVLRTHHYSCR